MTAWDEWEKILADFRRTQGLKDQDKCSPSEEEYNCHEEKVGPCIKDFGHVGPDKEDLITFRISL